MSKWQTLQELVDRSPGGKYIGTQWKDEPLVEVYFHSIEIEDFTVDSDQGYSFATNLLIAAVNEYGPLVEDEDEPSERTLNVPPLVAELFEFWADEHTWFCE